MDSDNTNPIALVLVLLTIVSIGAFASVNNTRDIPNPVDLNSVTIYGE